jgi:hypothetical protein
MVNETSIYWEKPRSPCGGDISRWGKNMKRGREKKGEKVKEKETKGKEKGERGKKGSNICTIGMNNTKRAQ